MSIELSELRDAAQKAFPADKLLPPRDASWVNITEMGWLMIDLPEELGGLGLGREAVASLHIEMGRVLSSAPLAPALLGLRAISGSDSLFGKADWIERIISGEYIPLHMLSAKVDGEGSLSGTISGVFDADMASHVVAALPGRYALIPLDAEGVTVTERPMWDSSRRVFDVALKNHIIAPEMYLARGEAAKAMHDAISPDAQIAVAADALGGAQAALAMTIEFLGLRKQFDRPLAMFQALKHRVADLRTLTGSAEALLWSCAANSDASLTEFGAMKAHLTDVTRIVTEDMIQLHGGIGLTQEHASHLFMKRAMLNLQLCGSLDHWRESRGRQILEKVNLA
jgi:alkylation response protein AidB-like acyl-CoA dehydrogenase